MNIIDFLCKTKICACGGEARRLILIKAIKINDVVIDNPDYEIDEEFYLRNIQPIYIKKGKKHRYTYHFDDDTLFACEFIY